MMCPSFLSQYDQTSNVVSPKTRAWHLPSIKGKPNKKTMNEKIQRFGGFPSIANAIKEFSQITIKMGI